MNVTMSVSEWQVVIVLLLESAQRLRLEGEIDLAREVIGGILPHMAGGADGWLRDDIERVRASLGMAGLRRAG